MTDATATPQPSPAVQLPRTREPGTGTREAWDDRVLSPDYRPRPQRTAWLGAQSRRAGDALVPDRGNPRRWGRYATAIARWEHDTGRSARPARPSGASGDVRGP